MAAVLLATDQALLLIGAQSICTGPFDETAHLLTGALVLAALRGCLDRSFALGVLAMSVLVDLDHVPALAGSNVITGGTDRPYSHSLLALAVLGLAALAWRARRPLLVGVAIGLAAHLARDLTESGSGVPLAWPLGRDSSTLPHWTYLVAIGAVVAIALWRARSAAA